MRFIRVAGIKGKSGASSLSVLSSLKRTLTVLQAESARQKRAFIPMAAEALALKAYNGICLTDYFMGNLASQDIPFSRKLEFLGEKKYERLLNKFSPVHLRSITTNKLHEKTLLTQMGLPTPRFIGLLHPKRGKTASGSPLTTMPELKTALKEQGLPSCVLKPVDSYGGLGIKFFVPNGGDGGAATAEKRSSKSPWHISDEYPLADDNFFRTWGHVCEETVVQHEALDALTPHSLNTLRIWVQKKGHAKPASILGAFLRMATDTSPVDNITSGGIFTPVEMHTGKLITPATQPALPVPQLTHHPLTHTAFSDVTIPYWKETCDLVQEAGFYYTGLNLLAFDIAISQHGPLIIESNCGDPRGQFKIHVGFGSLRKK